MENKRQLVSPQETRLAPLPTILDFPLDPYLVKEMEEVLLEKKAYGLAAPQLGLKLPIFLARPAKQTWVFVNPSIIYASTKWHISEEGCLTLPGFKHFVPRCNTVWVRYQDESGNQKEQCFRYLFGDIVQHEMDHLLGILISDTGKKG